jgi:hypothetical protein
VRPCVQIPVTEKEKKREMFKFLNDAMGFAILHEYY